MTSTGAVRAHQVTDLRGFLKLGICLIFHLTCLLTFSNNTSNMQFLFGQWQTQSEEWNKNRNVNCFFLPGKKTYNYFFKY